MFAKRSGLVLAILFPLNWVAIGQAAATIQWIDLALQGGGSVRATLSVVAGGKKPAVIFNHGTGVRQLGHEGVVSRDNRTMQSHRIEPAFNIVSIVFIGFSDWCSHTYIYKN